jgi:hypothetical protein
MIQSVRDILALQMAPTEKFIRLVWIVYLAMEVHSWVSLIWHAYPNIWHQGLWAITATTARVIQQGAYVIIVYFILQLAGKLLTENKK